MGRIGKRLVFIAAMLLFFACRGGRAGAQDAGAGRFSELQRDLLQATVTALDLELKAARHRLAAAGDGAGQEENVRRIKSGIAELEKDRERYQTMAPADYPSPAGEVTQPSLDRKYGPVAPAVRREISVTVKAPYMEGSLLDLDDASRSGPFYRLAGIKGGCPCVLKQGQRYALTVYLVYRREYFGFIDDYYVYAADYRQR